MTCQACIGRLLTLLTAEEAPAALGLGPPAAPSASSSVSSGCDRLGLDAASSVPGGGGNSTLLGGGSVHAGGSSATHSRASSLGGGGGLGGGAGAGAGHSRASSLGGGGGCGGCGLFTQPAHAAISALCAPGLPEAAAASLSAGRSGEILSVLPLLAPRLGAAAAELPAVECLPAANASPDAATAALPPPRRWSKTPCPLSERRGSSPWPQQPASGQPKVDWSAPTARPRRPLVASLRHATFSWATREGCLGEDVGSFAAYTPPASPRLPASAAAGGGDEADEAAPPVALLSITLQVRQGDLASISPRSYLDLASTSPRPRLDLARSRLDLARSRRCGRASCSA